MLLCVLQASKNEEQDMLIYNWKPWYTGRKETGEQEQDFQQTYVFDPVKKHKQLGQGLLSKWMNWA